ncbi:putative T7SS-secreted protein [Streptomyces sp. enrichment culture]|uniref:WXG100 family type VII secretion target n=1 Tax=Streptomyces sp. enrichment culture TaxID=1795815 RepID=UPI003F55B0F6
MTLAPESDRDGVVLDPRSRADLGLPQGLKSAPRMPNPDCPHLGFNPVPGDTETVRRLHKKLSGCAEALQDTHDVVTGLLDGSHWKGDAAVAFREQLDDGPLPLNLKNAAHSLRKAARQLSRWEGELDDFRRRAKQLEDDAREARAEVDRAEGRAARAEGHPDLEKEGSDREAARRALTRANNDVEEAQAELDKVIGRAKRLAEEHERRAQLRARKIRDATKKLAPQEPGWFDEALDWLGDNLPDILSFTAGLIAAAALLLAGPLGWSLVTVAALMLTTSTISLTAFFLRLSDPEVRMSLWDGVRKGELDADFWSNTVSAGADFVGALPGIGAVVKGGYTGFRAAMRSTTAIGLSDKAALVGAKTMDEARAVADLGNALVARAVRGTTNPETAAKVMQGTAGAVGVGTAGFGLYNKVVDSDDDGIKDGTVAGIDGTRLVLDSGAIYDLARHVF